MNKRNSSLTLFFVEIAIFYLVLTLISALLFFIFKWPLLDVATIFGAIAGPTIVVFLTLYLNQFGIQAEVIKKQTKLAALEIEDNAKKDLRDHYSHLGAYLERIGKAITPSTQQMYDAGAKPEDKIMIDLPSKYDESVKDLEKDPLFDAGVLHLQNEGIDFSNTGLNHFIEEIETHNQNVISLLADLKEFVFTGLSRAIPNIEKCKGTQADRNVCLFVTWLYSPFINGWFLCAKNGSKLETFIDEYFTKISTTIDKAQMINGWNIDAPVMEYNSFSISSANTLKEQATVYNTIVDLLKDDIKYGNFLSIYKDYVHLVEETEKFKGVLTGLIGKINSNTYEEIRTCCPHYKTLTEIREENK